jgi:hypothetical protein
MPPTNPTSGTTVIDDPVVPDGLNKAIATEHTIKTDIHILNCFDFTSYSPIHREDHESNR